MNPAAKLAIVEHEPAIVEAACEWGAAGAYILSFFGHFVDKNKCLHLPCR
jgi:hypothetical protein